MAALMFSKSGVTPIVFSRGDAWPRATPGDERQTFSVSEGKTVRVATLSLPEEFLILDFRTETALPTADYTNLGAFLKHALITFRAQSFTFTDFDASTQTVRYWGGYYEFVQTTPGRYQGTLTLRRE